MLSSQLEFNIAAIEISDAYDELSVIKEEECDHDDGRSNSYIMPEWKIERCNSKSTEVIYLSRSCTMYLNKKSSPSLSSLTSIDSCWYYDKDDDEFDDENTVTNNFDQDTPTTYHVLEDEEEAKKSSCVLTLCNLSIVWSPIWCVPVLYFHVTFNDGTPLSRNDVLYHLTRDKDESCNETYCRQEDLDNFVSEEEHPITGIPSFFFHPCRTRERLDILEHASNNNDISRNSAEILLSWMSMILQTVRLSPSPKIYSLLQQQIQRKEN